MPFGVDEAGRGPVIGSMFAAAVWIDDPERLPVAVDDSKRLAPARREAIADALEATDGLAVGVAEVPVDRIDDPGTDMNTLTVDAHARAIETALEDVPRSAPAGLCDACDTDPDRFARRVGDALGVEAAIDARHGADADDPLVAAASVIAKVRRDAHVGAIADEYGDVGSGYPGDRTTRAFLEEYVADEGRLPPVARASWSTCEDVLAAATQTDLGEF